MRRADRAGTFICVADILSRVELLFTAALLIMGLAIALMIGCVAYRLYAGQR